MAKMHYRHLHGSLCRTYVPESSLTMYSYFVTCRNCLYLMRSIKYRLTVGEVAVGKTYSRQVTQVKRAIWEMKNVPPTKGWPTIHQIADHLEISPHRVFDICDTEQSIRMDKVSDLKGPIFEMTRARLINTETV